MSIAMDIKKDVGYVPILVVETFTKFEERINGDEQDAMQARWDCGKYLLEQRVGKQLPKGFLDNLCKEIGVGRSELTKRAKFAEKFPTEKEVRNAVTHFPAWREMVSKGLTDKHAIPKPKHIDLLGWRRSLKELKALRAADLKETDWKLIDAAQEQISRLYDELTRQKRVVK